MARVPCKHLILVAFFLFFFISTTASARNMPVAKESTDQKVHDSQVLSATEDHGAPNISVDELVSMDYTPATRKPPIHN
ncbi:hypothetical protein REPUB_Repub10bG0088900 [Reevesia pubescens]